MPTTLNVGLSKKVGQPNYGSRGASVHLETELDTGVVNDPDRLRDRIRQMFRQARGAIHEELAGDDSPIPANGNTEQRSNGDMTSANAPANGHRERTATESQSRALYAIAQRQCFDLSSLLIERFGSESPEDLSLRDASRLIDELNDAVIGSVP